VSRRPGLPHRSADRTSPSIKILSAWDAHIKNYMPNNGFDYGGRLMAAWIDR
jgi:hypothetical protein